MYVNTTADTHPMHTHLFTFQVMGRFPFDAKGYQASYGTPTARPRRPTPIRRRR